jgi:hypothetical protein
MGLFLGRRAGDGLIRATSLTLWYKHHWEANHILSGTEDVTDLTTGESWTLEPGVA